MWFFQRIERRPVWLKLLSLSFEELQKVKKEKEEPGKDCSNLSVRGFFTLPKPAVERARPKSR